MRKILALLLFACTLPVMAGGKYVGGDISLLPSYVGHGAKYYDTEGNRISSPLAYFKELGMNAMRVRLFVDPSKAPSDEKGQGVCQDLEYVKALGKEIKDAGLALMLDFHYSDSWADPSKQFTPDSWGSLNDNELYTKIYEYTKDALQQMNAVGATPDFIQTGNEISYGMLWGKRTDSSSSLKKCYVNNDANWPRFTTLLKKAVAACREECPQAKVVIHTERVAQSDVLKSFYDKMKSYDVDYDIIGISYYSYYHGNLAKLETALNKLETNFPDKDIMVVETGYYHDWQPNSVDYDLSGTYPINGEGQKAFTEALIEKLNSHEKVKGLFWWFMEANEYGLDWSTQRVTDNWYNAGLFDNQTGNAEPAIKVLKNFIGDETTIDALPAKNDTRHTIHTIDGRVVNKPHVPGIYIIDGKKMAVRLKQQ